jgi:hypothetical protein
MMSVIASERLPFAGKADNLFASLTAPALSSSNNAERALPETA